MKYIAQCIGTIKVPIEKNNWDVKNQHDQDRKRSILG